MGRPTDRCSRWKHGIWFMSWMECGVLVVDTEDVSNCRGFESDFILFWLFLLYFAQSIYLQFKRFPHQASSQQFQRRTNKFRLSYMITLQHLDATSSPPKPLVCVCSTTRPDSDSPFTYQHSQLVRIHL